MAEESRQEAQEQVQKEGVPTSTESADPIASAAHRQTVEAGLDLVFDVPLEVRVEIGNAKMMVREVLQLGKGSVVELDRMNGDPADLLVNDRLIARGEVTVVDERVAIRIVEVVGTHGLDGKLS